MSNQYGVRDAACPLRPRGGGAPHAVRRCLWDARWCGLRGVARRSRGAFRLVMQDYVLEGGTAHTSKCRCDCPEGFEGEHCETACPAASRIILAVN